MRLYNVLLIVAGSIVITIVQIIVPFYKYDLTTFSNSLWLALSNSLVLSTLVAYFLSTASKPKLLHVFIIYYIPGCLSILIEAYMFGVMNLRGTLYGLIAGIITSLLIVGIIPMITKTDAQVPTRRNTIREYWNLTWRIAFGTLLYVLVYFIAGIALQLSYPQLNSFYSGKLPQLDVIVYTQLIRGFILVQVGVWFVRYSTLPNLKKYIMLGFIFSILGGIAPLLAPNNLMPVEIRMAHGIEVGLSNFLFGFLIARLLSTQQKVVPN